jgi:predicted transposase YdaD
VILRDNVYTERAEGRAEGREEGIAIGAEQNRLENAKAFKDAGVDETFIAKTLGLSIDVVHNL